MLLGRRSIRLAAPLTLLSCCRASARLQHTGAALLARSAHGRHHDVAMRSALLTRLRGGNMTTDAGAEAGKPIVIETLDDFETALQDADDKLVVVDFTATWCGPCKMIAPVFDAIAAEYAGKVVCLKVDVDENQETAADCGIRAMPTFQFYKGGARLAEFAGADGAKLQQLVKEHA